ncbi:hypothetical protein HBO11_02205 [Pseudomonas sp. WS 5010]|uniref:hypothetical protein n=1 Tax=Pseudomonas sp. WS 5010 TaxID=2717489 RepID=UPI0014738487|nr:hypothetical protein [Pseudomonas sp. WS 5010]NMX84369.1 hypothetical protein [Pseudomonas sp. WS 5010]
MDIDKEKLKGLLWAEAASYRADCADWKRSTEALDEFLGNKTVVEVALELLAENVRLCEDPHMRAIRSLRGDCADLMAERDRLRTENDSLVAAAQALRDEWRNDQADAERYRYLRDRCGVVEYKAIAGSIGPGMLPSGETLDLAVDAVMGKGEQSNG